MSALSAEEQAAFDLSAQRVQRAAVAQLRTEPSAESAAAFVGHLQRGVDRVFAKALFDGASVDCSKGCSHCCNVRVHAMAPEVLLIADALRQWLPAALSTLTDKLHAHADAVRSQTVADHRQPCPFLQHDACSIYALRPAVCRKVHSLDVQACAAHLPHIPQHLRIIAESEALMRGVANAYTEVGLQAGSLELGRAVLLALTEPDALRCWAAGEVLFDAPEAVAAPR